MFVCVGNALPWDKFEKTDDIELVLNQPTPRRTAKRGGGRHGGADPHLDPDMDPKKAKRIVANRYDTDTHTRTHKHGDWLTGDGLQSSLASKGTPCHAFMCTVYAQSACRHACGVGTDGAVFVRVCMYVCVCVCT